MTVHELYVRIQAMLPKNTALRGIVGFVNYICDRVYDRGNWSFCHKKGVLAFIEPYETGTVALTNGAVGVVGTGTTFTSGMVGRKVRVDGGPEYKIATFTDTTHMDLDRNYTADTDSGLSYVIFQNEYSLASDTKYIRKLWDADNQVELVLKTAVDAKGRDVLSLTVGNTIFYATLGVDSSNNVVLLVQPYPTESAHLEYYYHRKLTAVTGPGSTIDLPGLDELVVQGVYARILELSDDKRANREWNRFKAMLDTKYRKQEPATDFQATLTRMDDALEWQIPAIRVASRVTL